MKVMGVNQVAIKKIMGVSMAVPSAANFTDLLALARADAPAAGTLYQDSATGAYYRYKTVGPGILVSADYYGRIGAIQTQDEGEDDNGPMYVTLADATSDLTGRGWVLDTYTALTKTADQPLVLDATDGNHRALWNGEDYTPATSTGLYVIAKVENTTVSANATDGNRLFEFGSSAREVNLMMGNNSDQGQFEWSPASTAIDNTSFDVGAAVTWVHAYFPVTSNSEGVAWAQNIGDLNQNIYIEYDDLGSGGGARFVVLVIGTSGYRGVLKIYEMFLFAAT